MRKLRNKVPPLKLLFIGPRGQHPPDFLHSHPKAGAVDRAQVHLAIPALVKAGVDHRFGGGGCGVKLHAVGLHAGDGRGVRREQAMRDLGEHPIESSRSP